MLSKVNLILWTRKTEKLCFKLRLSSLQARRALESMTYQTLITFGTAKRDPIERHGVGLNEGAVPGDIFTILERRS